jgi:phosphate transport system ATP-binding protein
MATEYWGTMDGSSGSIVPTPPRVSVQPRAVRRGGAHRNIPDRHLWPFRGARSTAKGAAVDGGSVAADRAASVPDASEYYLTEPVAAGYADPAYDTGYARPAYETGYAQPAYETGYPEPVYPTSYAEPAHPTAYAEPAYATGYAEPQTSAYGDTVIDLTQAPPTQYMPAPVVTAATHMDARSVSAWFGSHKVLDRVSLFMPAGTVTALIGPSGCGKSTFLRILNRMHELIPSASLAGEVLLNGEDIYDASRRVTQTRKRIGMVFQKPNPFPAMSIADNVVAGLKLNGIRAGRSEREDLVQECLTRGGLWNEVKDRLDQPGGALSGGQQQRLCIARSLAVRPEVLLMDEPCSALDPTSTRRVEETIAALAVDVTIVIVTHNMQQAARVSQQCAFFLAEQGTPGFIVESGTTRQIFNEPRDLRTRDYVEGRFG